MSNCLSEFPGCHQIFNQITAFSLGSFVIDYTIKIVKITDKTLLKEFFKFAHELLLIGECSASEPALSIKNLKIEIDNTLVGLSLRA